MKNVLPHIVRLSFLFLCSYVVLAAYPMFASFSQQTILQNHSKTKLVLPIQTHFSSSMDANTRSKKKAIVLDNEEEDIENTVSKKTVEKSNYSPSVFNQALPTFCTTLCKKQVVFSTILKHLPSYNSALYLLFEVFRI